MTEADKLEFEIMEKAQKLAALRQQDGGVEVPDYAFQTLAGATSLSRLFAGRERLLMIGFLSSQRSICSSIRYVRQQRSTRARC